MTEKSKAEAVRCKAEAVQFVKNFCIRRTLELIQQDDLERAMATLQVAIAVNQCLKNQPQNEVVATSDTTNTTKNLIPNRFIV